MFDAAVAYDTRVVDDPDAPVHVAPDFEVVVQALVMGAWHRTIPGEPIELACECPVPVRHYPPTRRELLTNRGGTPLCTDGCFTPRELERARLNDEKTLAREAAEEAEEQKRRDEFFASLRKKRPTNQGDR